MKRSEMIAKMKQLSKNQQTIEEVFTKNKDEQRAEVARIKKIMYDNFAELLENWLDEEVVADSL